MENFNEDSLAAYIGISGPETPKFLLVNNFLSEFFSTDQSDKSRQYTFDDFQKAGILICEEDNEQKKQLLKSSFNHFFRHFSGEDMIRSHSGNQYFYFPLRPQMLRSSSVGLRHLLFNMLPDMDDQKKFHEMQSMISDYLYGESSGVNYLLSEMCEKIGRDENIIRSNRTNPEFEFLRKKSIYRQMCVNLKDDLECLLTHRFFRELDFYKRYDYLATLLNSYVIQFILKRSAESGGAEKGCIVCQGSATSHLLDRGEFHRACVQNYAEIRSVFPKKLKEFYVKRLEERVGKDQTINIRDEGGSLLVNNCPFDEFVKDVLNSKYRQKDFLYEAVKKVFRITKENRNYSFTAEEFAMYYIDVSKARKGSSLTKISSTLPTVGKDMEFIFPKSRSRHKYFAMSPSLLEFYVRLYLASEDSTYAYLDDFLTYLEERYHICIMKSERMDQVLRKLQIRVPFQEFRLNEQALLDNLEEINCLIRLSDSGYVISLPEEKGEFRLL